MPSLSLDLMRGPVAAAVPGLSGVAGIDLEAWKKIPSPFLKPAQVLELSRLIRNWAVEGYMVVTQGRDTLQETALDSRLLVDAEVSAVVTGAQRNPSLPSPDGPLNILGATITAQMIAAGARGVLVVFCSEIHAVRGVVKSHNSSVDSFKSPEPGLLGAVSNGKVLLWFRIPQCSSAFFADTAVLLVGYDVDGTFAKANRAHVPRSGHALLPGGALELSMTRGSAGRMRVRDQ